MLRVEEPGRSAAGEYWPRRGVIQIIVATVGVQIRVLNTASYRVVVLVAIVTSLMAPPIIRHAERRIPTTAPEEERLHP